MKPFSLRLIALAYLVVLAASMPAQAARPFVTDDARIVDAGHCQLESFIKQQRSFGERELWFLPACNLTGNLELTVGGLQQRNDTLGRSSTGIAQGKTLLRPLRTNDYGIALSAGALRQRPFGSDQASHWSPYFNFLSSISIKDDRAVFHINAGMLDDRNTAVIRPTWGAGTEILVLDRLYAIVESYGQKGEKTNQQVGVRYWAVPNRLQIDGTLGSQRSGPPARTWISLGVRMLF